MRSSLVAEQHVSLPRQIECAGVTANTVCLVDRAAEKLPGEYYGNQWHLFEVHCSSIYTAGRYAAKQNWWLHCWDWVEADHEEPVVVVVGNPDPPWSPR